MEHPTMPGMWHGTPYHTGEVVWNTLPCRGGGMDSLSRSLCVMVEDVESYSQYVMVEDAESGSSYKMVVDSEGKDKVIKM